MPAPWNWLHKLPIFSGCSKFKPRTSSISIRSLTKQVVDAWNSTYLLTRCVEHLRNLTRVLIGKKKQTLSEIFQIGGQTAITTIYGCFFTCLSRLTFEATRFNCNSTGVPIIQMVCSHSQRSMVDGCLVAIQSDTRSHQFIWSLIHIIQVVDHL